MDESDPERRCIKQFTGSINLFLTGSGIESLQRALRLIVERILLIGRRNKIRRENNGKRI